MYLPSLNKDNDDDDFGGGGGVLGNVNDVRIGKPNF